MTTKKKTPNTNAVSGLKTLQKKFELLGKYQNKISEMKDVYKQHDLLMEELLPLFIEVEANQITVRREITLGSKTYRFNPHFYDPQKARVVSKVWKSTAFPSATIET